MHYTGDREVRWEESKEKEINWEEGHIPVAEKEISSQNSDWVQILSKPKAFKNKIITGKTN